MTLSNTDTEGGQSWPPPVYCTRHQLPSLSPHVASVRSSTMSHPLELAPYTIGIQMQNTASEAGKGAFPHLIPFPAPPPRFSPAAAYLSRLAPSSQLTMTKLLGCLVELLGSSTPAEEFPWAHLDYGRAIRLRQTLASRYAPATANLALCALRGVLREAWRLGDMSYESFRRVSDLAQVRGDRPSPRRSIDTRSDETLRGRRDLAILSVLYGTCLRRSGRTQRWRTRCR